MLRSAESNGQNRKISVSFKKKKKKHEQKNRLIDTSNPIVNTNLRWVVCLKNLNLLFTDINRTQEHMGNIKVDETGKNFRLAKKRRGQELYLEKQHKLY